MAKPILSTRSKIPAAKADKLLRCYAKRQLPAEAAQRAGLSLNTVYDQYNRLRWRLIEVDYYRDAAFRKDEAGLSNVVKDELKRRRGLEDGDIYAHAAEAIDWAEEWPHGAVLRHLRKIIALTGPLDVPLTLDEAQSAVTAAYIRYARTQLIHGRIIANATSGDTTFAERVGIAMDNDWRSYRSAQRQFERTKKHARVPKTKKK